MDTFLTKLFRDDLEKQAASQTQELMGTLDIPELEEYLGLSKQAVAGPDHAPYPVANKGSDEARREWINVGIAQRHGDQPRQYKEQTEKKAGFERSKVPGGGFNIPVPEHVRMEAMKTGKSVSFMHDGRQWSFHPNLSQKPEDIAWRERSMASAERIMRLMEQNKTKFEARHGESPTSKENVKKPEQGNVGKEGCAMGKLGQAQLIQTAFHSTREAPAHLQKIAMKLVAQQLTRKE